MFSENVYESKDKIEQTVLNMGPQDDIKKIVQNEQKHSFIDDKVLRMMQSMGYKNGSGLGKNEQGITGSLDIAYQLGKRGLGLKIKKLEHSSESWDFTKEDICVKEEVNWLECKNDEIYDLQQMLEWIKEGCPKHDIENESNFCDEDVLHDVIQAKNIFDELDLLELCQARAKANPFETIKSVYFMNRAAVKIANIDAATGFMFSRIDEDEHHKGHPGPYYFADICAGPGGFTEYILWRRQWFFKGFGLTLRDENDFRLNNSVCTSPVNFQAIYGKDADGNVCSPDNIIDFRDKVKHETDGEGVHFLMADGGFSVDGKENLQEVLSKNIYLCQCVMALQVLQTNGHFVTKLFDIFTTFSVGLLYLMYKCFLKVSLIKPNSSRPANAERYFICYGLKNDPVVETIKQYLWIVVNKLWKIHNLSDVDILEIVPLDVIKNDRVFYKYIYESNNCLGRRQIIGLKKLAAFCRNPTLIDLRQAQLRKECLEYWEIPDKPKRPLPSLAVDDVVNLVVDKQEILLVQPREVTDIDHFMNTVQDVDDWHYCTLYSSQGTNHCNFYVSIGASKVYRLQRSKWVKVKNLSLCRGTILYGEFVKESAINKDVKQSSTCRYSLHVIDAIRLGEKDLMSFTFQERLEQIRIYCKSINKECDSTSVRVRPKLLDLIGNLACSPLMDREKDTKQYYQKLPVLGFNMLSEFHDINSLLLLKTNSNQSFHSTYVLRVQIFLETKKNYDMNKCILVDKIVSNLNGRL